MKYYKILNLNRQDFGPFVATDNWMKEAKTMPKFLSQFTILGECDSAGNLLNDIAKQNFSQPDAPVPAVFKPESKTVENGEQRTESGAETGKGKKGKKAAGADSAGGNFQSPE